VTAVAALAEATPPDGDERDDLATATLRVGPPPAGADLALAERVLPATAGPGDPVTYTTTVTNKGPGVATGVEVADPVTRGTFLASAASIGAVTGLPARTGAAVRWLVGTLAPGASATWTVRALAGAPGRSEQTVLVTQAGGDDRVAANNVARAALVVSGANLGLTRDVSNVTPTFGQEVVVTLTARNAGPDRALGVSVGEGTDAGLVLISAQPDSGSYDQDSGTWSVGDLEPGAEATLTLRSRVAMTGDIASRSTIDGRAPSDPDSADNVAETVLAAAGDAPQPAPVFRTGFPLPFTEVGLSTMDAIVVGGLMIAVGFVLLLLLRQ
jgi:uncharacterized repeat protein (TIGR01451 family)